MTRSGLMSSGYSKGPRLRALLDEEIEGIVDRHVGDDVDLDLQLVDGLWKHVARKPVAVRILLMIHEMVGGRNLQRVRDDPGAAVGRGPEPDNLRAEGNRAVVFVMREVVDGGSDRHGFRGLVTVRRPFHKTAAPHNRSLQPRYRSAGASPSKPQAASASSMWGGAGASTSIGGFDFESGTITRRASNWSGRSARAP